MFQGNKPNINLPAMPLFPKRPITITNGVSCLLTAAIIDNRFCNLLLSDPKAAIKRGYNGEPFTFSAEEEALICSIHANTLSEFASQVIQRRNGYFQE